MNLQTKQQLERVEAVAEEALKKIDAIYNELKNKEDEECNYNQELCNEIVDIFYDKLISILPNVNIEKL